MGLYLVSDSYYSKIPIDDPEEKLRVFSLECIMHDNEDMFEELLHESQQRLQHLGSTPAALFGLATYHIANYHSKGLALLDDAIKLAGSDPRYLLDGLLLLKDVGINDDNLEIPFIQKYVERIIRQIPYDDDAVAVAEFFALTRLDYTEERFQEELNFSLHRIRFKH